MVSRSRSLTLEILEDRDLLSSTAWGTPWPDASHLTLSFAPDGTNISGTPSNLYSGVLANAGANGQMAILSAFQTWADVANINFGLVSDNGEAFGAGRAIEGNTQFGDIRVGARPLESDVVALTSPFDYLSTYTGDMVFNSSQPIGSTYNLYTIALHEVGHALGLPDNSNPTSVMYEYYTGTNNTLSASDISAVQALYGVRGPNSTSDTLSTAVNYTQPVYGSLNSSSDADFYRFSTPLLLTGTTVHLQAEGLSLLDAQVSVFNSQGKLVETETATDPTNNDLTLSLTNLKGLSNYYVEVSSPNGGVFDVGTYDLTITNTFVGAVGDVLGGVLGLVDSVGHTLLSATSLLPLSSLTDSYAVRATLGIGTPVDVFEVQAPPASADAAAMVVSAWALDNDSISPQLQVFDSSGNAVPFQVLTSNSGTSIIQVTDPVPGAKYFISVSSSTGATGGYSMAADFLNSAINFPMTASGTLNAAAPSTSGTLTVPQSQFIHFVVASSPVPSDPNATITMTILDSDGNVVEQLQEPAGSAASVDLFLPAGAFTVTISAGLGENDTQNDIDFTLGAIGISDPVAIQSVNPSTTTYGTSSSSSSSSTTTNASATLAAKTPSGNSTWN